MKKQIFVLAALILPLCMQAGFKKNVELKEIPSRPEAKFSIEEVKGDETLFWFHEIVGANESHFQFRSKKGELNPLKMDMYLMAGDIVYDGKVLHKANKETMLEGSFIENQPTDQWRIFQPGGVLTNTILIDPNDKEKLTCSFFDVSGNIQREVILQMHKQKKPLIAKHPLDEINDILDVASLYNKRKLYSRTFKLVNDRYFYADGKIQAEISYHKGERSGFKYWTKVGDEKTLNLSNEVNTIDLSIEELKQVVKSLPENVLKDAMLNLNYNETGKLDRVTLFKEVPYTLSLSEQKKPKVDFSFGENKVPFVLNVNADALLEANEFNASDYKIGWDYYSGEGWKRTVKLLCELDYDGEVCMVVERMPEFPGGTEALIEYLSENVHYPVESQKMGVEGKVFVSFVVTSGGKVANVQIGRSVEAFIDAEAMRVVKNMPDWTPGIQKGKPVAVKYMLPINFVLQKQNPLIRN